MKPATRALRRAGLRWRIALGVLLCVVAAPAVAGFYTWVDAQGRRHVSNVPRDGIGPAGTLKDAHNPNSIVYQHARMRSALRREATEIEAEMAREEALRADAEQPAAGPTAPRRAPAEGIMNLDELIELEKRGGRYTGASPAP